jgi:hypothetical protein
MFRTSSEPCAWIGWTYEALIVEGWVEANTSWANATRRVSFSCAQTYGLRFEAVRSTGCQQLGQLYFHDTADEIVRRVNGTRCLLRAAKVLCTRPGR